MHQFSFLAVSKRNNHCDSIRATARDARIARWHVMNYYGHLYDISEEPTSIRPPHHVLGEIDCSDEGCESLVPAI